MAEAKDQFVATVSHDFRSPLAIIQSALQTLMSDPGMVPEMRHRFLARAERQCKRLSAMVHDLMDLARIENRETAIERTELSELVAEGVDAQRPGFDDKAVRLDYAPPAEPVLADVDPHYLARAITNLLDNALKFTPPQGRVEVRLSARDGWASIQVQDTGPGIAAEDHERIFERFYQGTQASSSGHGAGLGLAIVAGVARRHAGQARVESALGAGAMFELRLPQHLPETPKSLKTAAGPTPIQGTPEQS
jgi:signal transduction histidine kinase